MIYFVRKKDKRNFVITLAVAFFIPPIIAWTMVSEPEREGWQSSYEPYIVSVIHNHTDLLDLTQKQMRYFTDKWDEMSRPTKAEFLAEIVQCMSKAESNHNRLAVFREYGIPGKDAITGMPIVSEGLLQISYQDQKYYKGQCDFDWKSDAKAFRKDMKKKGQSFNGTDGRSILDAHRNLACGLQIMDTLAKKHKQYSAQYAWGRYWAVMRTERPGYKKFKQCMRGMK